MTEYIDRKALLEAMMRKKSGLASRRYVEGWNDCLMRVRSMVSTAPSADVAPVAHEKWAHLDGDRFCCTNCGFIVSTEGSWEKPTQKYCENCGARMDGGTDNG